MFSSSSSASEVCLVVVVVVVVVSRGVVVGVIHLDYSVSLFWGFGVVGYFELERRSYTRGWYLLGLCKLHMVSFVKPACAGKLDLVDIAHG